VQRDGVEVPVEGDEHAAQVATNGDHIARQRGPHALIQRVFNPEAALDRRRRRRLGTTTTQRHASVQLLLLLWWWDCWGCWSLLLLLLLLV
jgi:hypothetical protein